MATVQQIPNTRIFRSFLGTDFPGKKKKTVMYLLTKTATEAVDRESLMFSLTFRLGVYPSEQGKQNPNMTWTNILRGS